MTTNLNGTGAMEPIEQSLEAQLAAKATISNAVKQTGLGEIASTVRGDGFVVCDFNTHEVQGCADMRSAAESQKLAAEVVALGLVILVVVLVGSIAVTFVKLVTRLAQSPRDERTKQVVVHAGRGVVPIVSHSEYDSNSRYAY